MTTIGSSVVVVRDVDGFCFNGTTDLPVGPCSLRRGQAGTLGQPHGPNATAGSPFWRDRGRLWVVLRLDGADVSVPASAVR